MPSKELIEEIKKKLLDEKKILLKQASKTLSGLHATQEAQPDFGDRSSAEMEQNFILKLRDRDRKYIQKIDATLERLETGKYGVCDKCDSDIGEKRLMARPTVSLCIKCKTEEEKQDRR